MKNWMTFWFCQALYSQQRGSPVEYYPLIRKASHEHLRSRLSRAQQSGGGGWGSLFINKEIFAKVILRRRGNTKITSFWLDAVDTISTVSGSGLTPYFFIRWDCENSLRGIKANNIKIKSSNKINFNSPYIWYKYRIIYIQRERERDRVSYENR